MKDTYSFKIEVNLDHLEDTYGILYSYDVQGIEENSKNETFELECFYDDEETIKNVKIDLSNLNFKTTFTETILVEDQDWNANWRASMEPAKLTDDIWVSPLWLEPSMKEGDTWIKIEPKMAFGTGHHETTRLASEAILLTAENCKSKNLLDIGTGSGILCFIADHIGYGQSVGVEIDPDCRENIIENKELNNPTNQIDFLIGKIDALKPSVFNTIVVNMIRPRSEPLLKHCYEILKKDGKLIWTGILVVEKDSCIKNAQTIGWKIESETIEGEWWCGVLRK